MWPSRLEAKHTDIQPQHERNKREHAVSMLPTCSVGKERPCLMRWGKSSQLKWVSPVSSSLTSRAHLPPTFMLSTLSRGCPQGLLLPCALGDKYQISLKDLLSAKCKIYVRFWPRTLAASRCIWHCESPDWMLKEIRLIALQLLPKEIDFQPTLRRALFFQSFLQTQITQKVKDKGKEKIWSFFTVITNARTKSRRRDRKCHLLCGVYEKRGVNFDKH